MRYLTVTALCILAVAAQPSDVHGQKSFTNVAPTTEQAVDRSTEREAPQRSILYDAPEPVRFERASLLPEAPRPSGHAMEEMSGGDVMMVAAVVVVVAMVALVVWASSEMDYGSSSTGTGTLPGNN